jgi:hypothetical protein
MRSTAGSMKHQKLLVSALVTCAILTITSSSTRGDTTIEPGIDYFGADLLGFDVADVEQCRQECEKREAPPSLCKAYTFVAPQCFLKSSVPARRSKHNAISGVKGGWISGPFFTWVVGSDVIRARPLELASTDVCVLTRVSGKFVGGGESARVVVLGDRWFLEVRSSQEEAVSGIAYCFRKRGFLANGPQRRTSTLFEAREGHAVSTLNGDHATFVAGVNGHLRGGGEHTRIVQSPVACKPSELRVGSASGYLKSWAYAFFAGTSGSGLPAKFFQENEFSLNHVSGLFPKSVDMAPIDDAMCYFTRLQGQFDGGGEWAEIFADLDSKRWRLQAKAGGDAEVFAAARCYKRDQR